MTETSAIIRLARLIKAVEKMRTHQHDYTFHRVGTAGPKMRRAQREVDELLKEDKEFITKRQLELL